MSTSRTPGLNPAQRNGATGLGGLAWVIIAALGILCWIFAFQFYGGKRACMALLAAFNYFTPMAAGLTVWTAVVTVSRGSWAGKIENLAARGLGFAAPSILILALLWILSPAWSPWAGKHLEPTFFYNTNFILGRCMFALVVFWIAAGFYATRRRTGGAPYLGPVLIIVYAAAFSLLGFDLGMSTNPHWSSSLFGGYFFISGLYIAAAAWGLAVCLLDAAGESQRHDVGNLVLAFGMLTAYLFFAQTLPIWFENLPHENSFMLGRINTSWMGVTYAIIASVLAGQLLYLLPGAVKKSRMLLGIACAVVLAGMFLERWWMVMPSVERHPSFGLPEIGALLLCLGLFGLGYVLFEPGFTPPDFQRGDVP